MSGSRRAATKGAQAEAALLHTFWGCGRSSSGGGVAPFFGERLNLLPMVLASMEKT
jgi:hypothetical protein